MTQFSKSLHLKKNNNKKTKIQISSFYATKFWNEIIFTQVISVNKTKFSKSLEKKPKRKFLQKTFIKSLPNLKIRPSKKFIFKIHVPSILFLEFVIKRSKNEKVILRNIQNILLQFKNCSSIWIHIREYNENIIKILQKIYY